MSTVTMTLYEALNRKKILEDRVSKIQSYALVDCKKSFSDVSLSGVDIDDVDKSIKGGYSSTIALLNNFISLKAAINEANATVKVTIAGKEYSIANAIVRYRSLSDEERLYRRMLSNYIACEERVKEHNDKYLNPEKESDFISKVLGDSKKDTKLIEETLDNYRKTYQVEIYDPLNTKELAERKLEEIDRFKEEYNFALTEANCSNKITVEFED